MPAPATPPALTLAQESAVELLAAGKTDTDTAAALGLHRVTVTRWRLYSPDFRAALADRRAAVWGAAADRLRSLLPAALDAVAAVLADPAAPNRVPVALALLKLAGPLPTPPADPPDADALVRRVVDDERERARDVDDDGDALFGLPGDAHTRADRPGTGCGRTHHRGRRALVVFGGFRRSWRGGGVRRWRPNGVPHG